MTKLLNISTPVIGKLVSQRHNPIVSNFLSLGFIQGTNFLLGIITFPYIVRTIGIESFGIVTLLQTIMFYFTVFSDYGFSLSATKDISIERNNVKQLSRIYSEVISTKVVLVLISFLVLILSFFVFDTFDKFLVPTLLSFTIVLGQLVQPTWFFQGVEKMKYMTYTNILIRGLYAIGIFTFIRGAEDYIYVNLVNGITSAIGGLLSIYIIHKKFKVKFSVAGFKAIKRQLLEGRSIFLSNASTTIANNTNIVVLGLFASPLILGFYSVAEKVFLILRTFAGILYQVVYPRICVLASKSFEELSVFLSKLLKIILAAFLPISLLCLLLADQIIFYIAGKYISEAAMVLRIVSFGPLMAALNIPVAQTLLAYKLNRHFAYVVSVGAILNVSLNFVLAYYFQATGTAWSIIITETVITALFYLLLYKRFPQYAFFKQQ